MALLDSREIDRFKSAAAAVAAGWVTDGMVVGLGSGSTAAMVVAAIGRRVAAGLKIVGVPTSEKTADQARGLGIPLSTLEEHGNLDMAIDGADEVETGTLHLIKGGGGNQLREKLVALASARFVIVVDSGKVVDRLGSRAPVPVEVVRFGWTTTAARLEKMGAHPTRRAGLEGAPYITDGGNYILDCAYGPIADPIGLQAALDGVVGVVEHGLFLGMASDVIVAGPEGERVMKRGG